MSTGLRFTISWLLFSVLHGTLTVIFFLLYVDHAMKLEQGLRDPSFGGTALQYLKTLLLWPILLPLLRWQADLISGAKGYILVLVNSSIWFLGYWWLWQRIRRQSWRRVKPK